MTTKLNRIAKTIENLFDNPRQLSDAEYDALQQYIDTHPTTDELLIALDYYDLLSAPANPDTIGTQLMSLPLKSFISSFNPTARQHKAYLCLDSRYATFSESNTKLSWTFSNMLNEFSNSTNTNLKVGNIISARLYSTVIHKFTNTMNRATICVEEWKAQSFVSPNGRHFHFMSLLNDLRNPVNIAYRNAVSVYYVPDAITFDKYELLSGYRFNEGIYHFNKPITTLDNLTLSFGDPFTPINMHKYEHFNCTISNLTPTTDYSALTNLVITFTEPHYFSTVVPSSTNHNIFSVYIQDFTTSTPENANDAAIISDINSTEFTLGWFTDTQELTLNAFGYAQTGALPATRAIAAGLVLNGTPSTCTLLLNGHRIIANLELTMLK